MWKSLVFSLAVITPVLAVMGLMFGSINYFLETEPVKNQAGWLQLISGIISTPFAIGFLYWEFAKNRRPVLESNVLTEEEIIEITRNALNSNSLLVDITDEEIVHAVKEYLAKRDNKKPHSN